MDVLRLSDEQHQWLQHLSSETLFADENLFLNFVQDVAESLTTSKHSLHKWLKTSSGADRKPEELLAVQQGVAGLSSIFIEAAKRSSAADAVGLYLQAIGLPDPRVKVITNIYYAQRSNFRRVLSSTGFGFPQITDVNWRLDWTIKSNELPRICEPIYRIQLDTLAGNNEGIGAVTFSSSMEELQELVWGLKNAIKSIEHHSQL